MSSRKARLSPEDRARATALHRSLLAVRNALTNGERNPAAARTQALAELTSSEIEPEYLELVSPDTMAPVRQLDGDVLAVVAARLGATRLIDNELIHLDGRP
jgi:pantoate--beta-alanine ligase